MMRSDRWRALGVKPLETEVAKPPSKLILPRRVAVYWHLTALCIALVFSASIRAYDLLPSHFCTLQNGHKVLRPPIATRPDLHKRIADPVFGTTLMRVTDASQIEDVERIRHYYAKNDPFNADGTRALMYAGDGTVWMYDAVTWEPLKQLPIVSARAEAHWHPEDPDLLYLLDAGGESNNVRAFYRYNILTEKKEPLREFFEYTNASGQFEGNFDRLGRYYALIGRSGDAIDAFVYDLRADSITGKITVDEVSVGDWISVSPSGEFVVTMGADRSRIYDIEMNLVHELPEGTFGHGDLCLGADGNEYLVFDGADYQLDNNRNINKANLRTGKVSKVTRIGWSSTPHVSCRATEVPGWALVSTSGPDQRYPNHDFEIFWVRLNGSGEVRRVAHHHSDRASGGYFAEAHAVSNRNGTRLLFASNRGGEEVYDYLIELAPGGCQ